MTEDEMIAAAIRILEKRIREGDWSREGWRHSQRDDF
jgi:hypothetical protein